MNEFAPQILKMPKKKCVVLGCLGGSKSFRFPQYCLGEWCKNLRIEVGSIKAQSRICEQHFTDVCQSPGGRLLRAGSMPTINLGHDREPVYQPCFESYQRMCCVVGCVNKSPASILHAFPTDPQKREKWKQNCNIKRSMQNNIHLCICNEHFDPQDVFKTKLRKNSYPIMDIEGIQGDQEELETDVIQGDKEEVIEVGCQRCDAFSRNEQYWRNKFMKLSAKHEELEIKCLEMEEELGKLRGKKQIGKDC